MCDLGGGALGVQGKKKSRAAHTQGVCVCWPTSKSDRKIFENQALENHERETIKHACAVFLCPATHVQLRFVCWACVRIKMWGRISPQPALSCACRPHGCTAGAPSHGSAALPTHPACPPTPLPPLPPNAPRLPSHPSPPPPTPSPTLPGGVLVKKHPHPSCFCARPQEAFQPTTPPRVCTPAHRLGELRNPRL